MTKTVEKTLYRIDINWFGETHTFYRYVSNEGNALALGVVALAQEVEHSHNSVLNYVHDGHDRYLVRKETTKNDESKSSTEIA